MTNQTALFDRMLHHQTSQKCISSATWQNNHDTVDQNTWTSALIIDLPPAGDVHISYHNIVAAKRRDRRYYCLTAKTTWSLIQRPQLAGFFSFTVEILVTSWRFSRLESSCLYVLAQCACSCIRPVHLQWPPSARLILKLPSNISSSWFVNCGTDEPPRATRCAWTACIHDKPREEMFLLCERCELKCNEETYSVKQRRQYNYPVKEIPQSVVVMSYNLCQSNVNPTLPSLLVTGHTITDLRLPNITPWLKNWIHSHQTQYHFYSF